MTTNKRAALAGTRRPRKLLNTPVILPASRSRLKAAIVTLACGAGFPSELAQWISRMGGLRDE